MLHVRVQRGSEQRQQEVSHVVNALQNLSVNRSNATSRNSLGTWREAVTPATVPQHGHALACATYPLMFSRAANSHKTVTLADE